MNPPLYETLKSDPVIAPRSFSSVSRPVLQRKCDCGGAIDRDGACNSCGSQPALQRKADPTSSASSSAAPESVHRTLGASGDPLDAGTRDFMESRFGHDFGRVRVHTDDQAGESARAVNAQAYTAGNHIAFAPGKYRPDSADGQKLLAHELAHTVQQGSAPAAKGSLEVDTNASSALEREADDAAQSAVSGRAASVAPGSAARIARAPVAGYETKPINIERADIEKFVGVSYWEQKVGERFLINRINDVSARFTADPEERDAVLSVLWQRRPTAPYTSDQKVTTSIPARAGQAASKPLLYQFTFKPVPKDAPAGTQETVDIDFKAEGSQAAVTNAPAPAAGYAAPDHSPNAEDFPDGISDYWTRYPEEKRQLYSWIETVAGPAFDQIVTTSSTPPKGRKHDTTYRVKGSKTPVPAKGATPATTKLSLDITYLSETPTFVDTPPAGYGGKDFADLQLEKEQGKRADKLGAINGLASLPADEVLSVKYAVWQYFQGGTRNKEVDVILPIAQKQTRVFYTLRFQPTTNDVEVARVGEEKSNAKLTLDALNIERVAGFAANSGDAAAFTAWIAKRYPGVAPSGATLADLEASVNKEMVAKAGTEAWFTANYGIEILDPTAAEARITSIHGRTPAELANLKSFTPDDLKRLEFALQTMSDAELKILKGTKMARQDVKIELLGKTQTPTPDPKTGGYTEIKGTEKTVSIYDSATGNDQYLFTGGTEGVRSPAVGTYAHEFGHILEDQARLAAPFAAFVAGKHIPPLTWYASSKPVTESFPEAFFIFHTDPEWMRSNVPALYTWMDTVSRTGAPPKS